jgi:hypothetical protein
MLRRRWGVAVSTAERIVKRLKPRLRRDLSHTTETNTQVHCRAVFPHARTYRSGIGDSVCTHTRALPYRVPSYHWHTSMPLVYRILSQHSDVRHGCTHETRGAYRSNEATSNPLRLQRPKNEWMDIIPLCGMNGNMKRHDSACLQGSSSVRTVKADFIMLHRTLTLRQDTRYMFVMTKRIPNRNADITERCISFI